MVKQFRFNLKLDGDDRERLLWLSGQLGRTQADTVRWLIRRMVAARRAQRLAGAWGPFPPELPDTAGDWEAWDGFGEEPR